MSTLTDKELKVLEQIARESTISQRAMAEHTGISLGLINAILKKLLKTGHLQVSQMNRRSMQYFLTSSGFLEMSRRTCSFAVRTIRDYRRIYRELSLLLLGLTEDGVNYFSIHGDGDIKRLITTLAKDILKDSNAMLGEFHRTDSDAVVLNITADSEPLHIPGRVINVLESIALQG